MSAKVLTYLIQTVLFVFYVTSFSFLFLPFFGKHYISKETRVTEMLLVLGDPGIPVVSTTSGSVYGENYFKHYNDQTMIKHSR